MRSRWVRGLRGRRVCSSSVAAVDLYLSRSLRTETVTSRNFSVSMAGVRQTGRKCAEKHASRACVGTGVRGGGAVCAGGGLARRGTVRAALVYEGRGGRRVSPTRSGETLVSHNRPADERCGRTMTRRNALV